MFTLAPGKSMVVLIPLAMKFSRAPRKELCAPAKSQTHVLTLLVYGSAILRFEIRQTPPSHSFSGTVFACSITP
jgi:hypothetical protein